MSLQETGRIRIPLEKGQQLQSLVWAGDELVDWAGGGNRYRLDGTMQSAHRIYWSCFDHAQISPDGRFILICERLGIKGLLLRADGTWIREINRSFYCAEVYEYPATFFQLPDGRTVLAHCPDEYDRLEFEEVETGRRLATRSGKCADFFHSRLQVSPDGLHLLSAGWVWHPVDVLMLFSVPAVLEAPTLLNKGTHVHLPPEEKDPCGIVHVTAAVFVDNETVVLTHRKDKGYLEENPVLACYDLRRHQVVSHIPLAEQTGSIVALSKDYIIDFYGHPKLLKIASGEVVQRWPELASGQQISSIIMDEKQRPVLAVDARGKRFAVADDAGITVIQLG